MVEIYNLVITWTARRLQEERVSLNLINQTVCLLGSSKFDTW